MLYTKKVCLFFLLTLICFRVFSNNIEADSLGLPGDHLDLYGVLEIFKKSKNPEDFEKALNSEDNGVNNLDLNEDGEVDYIRVLDRNEDNVHVLVLQTPINENESQDIAVIEVEKTAEETAHIQIIGDEELYGKDYIIEPADESDSNENRKSADVTIVNVWAWPCIRYVYTPGYALWVSPWRWRYYPVWWKPWKPIAWHIHRKNVWHYHAHYRPVYVYRIPIAHKVYYKHRVVSPVYKAKYHRPYKSVPPPPKKVKKERAVKKPRK
jgi:hypothetical protein